MIEGKFVEHYIHFLIKLKIEWFVLKLSGGKVKKEPVSTITW
ncbi:hypothetical protein [Neobacillus cucumis]|nr:hypothetical protein [Neobacillus cucumis]